VRALEQIKADFEQAIHRGQLLDRVIHDLLRGQLLDRVIHDLLRSLIRDCESLLEAYKIRDSARDKFFELDAEIRGHLKLECSVRSAS
jgi:hypothetical protein